MIQTARSASARPACSEREANELTVTARLGTAFVPLLRTAITKRSGLARRCLVGNEARTTSTRKLPDGSFASWRSPPPQPATAIAATIAQGTRTRHAGLLYP